MTTTKRAAAPDDAPPPAVDRHINPWRTAPLMLATESSRNIFVVITLAAMLPLAAGVVFFGYRALVLAIISIMSCVTMEWAYFRILRAPAMHGRSHAVLTGTLLALTLPASAPWYVPVVGAAFAIIVGKAIFGGVGHFLWQPALIGRLAVAVMFGTLLQAETMPLLSPSEVLTGDVLNSSAPEVYHGWHDTPLPRGVDAFLLRRPPTMLAGLGDANSPQNQSISEALLKLPPISQVLYGAAPGGIGETSILTILLAGLYLIHRNYVKAILPGSFILAAAAVLAIAPVYLDGSEGVVRKVWLPITAEGLDVGFTYINYHLWGGELMLAAFFLAPEMTSRPVTTGGQLLFGLGCGAIAMLLQLYFLFPLACYVAVLAMNTFTPLLERMTRPHVIGTPRWWQRLAGRHPR